METITYKNELLAKTTESANLMEGERLFHSLVAKTSKTWSPLGFKNS